MHMYIYIYISIYIYICTGVCVYDEAQGRTCRGDVKRENNGNPARLFDIEARSSDEKRGARRLSEGSKEIRAHASYISDVCIYGCIYIYIYMDLYAAYTCSAYSARR